MWILRFKRITFIYAFECISKFSMVGKQYCFYLTSKWFFMYHSVFPARYLWIKSNKRHINEELEHFMYSDYISINTGWNDKIVILKKQPYSFILKLLLKKSIQVTRLCSRADIYSMQPPSASITASIRIRNWEHTFFTSAGGSSANTQRSGWLWCCGRSCWWCSRHMTEQSSPAGSGQEHDGLD